MLFSRQVHMRPGCTRPPKLLEGTSMQGSSSTSLLPACCCVRHALALEQVQPGHVPRACAAPRQQHAGSRLGLLPCLLHRCLARSTSPQLPALAQQAGAWPSLQPSQVARAGCRRPPP